MGTDAEWLLSQTARSTFHCAGAPTYSRIHIRPGTWGKDVIQMSEDELATRRALQESLDLRDQGHTDA